MSAITVLKAHRLRAAMIALVASVAFLGMHVADGQAAGWSNPYYYGVQVPTQAYVDVSCDTWYRSDGWKEWRVIATLRIQNTYDRDLIQTSFALVTSGGFRHSNFWDWKFPTGALRASADILDQKWIVPKTATAENVVASAAFWRNGVYGGTENAQFMSSQAGYSTRSTTSCRLY